MATRHGISPRLSSSSISTRCSRAIEPWCALRDLLLRELVQTQRQPLGETAVVDEDDRRAVLLDEPQELGVHRRPDRGRRRPLAAGAEQRVGRRAGPWLAHVFDGNDDLEVELLPAAGVHDPDRPCPGHEPADLLDRPLRRREADALDRLADQPVEPLDREREVRPALRPGDGVHLVQDQRPDGLQHLPPLRGEQQEERLRSGDQDVGRPAQHRRALLLRRVAGAHRHGQLRLEPGERAAQVALDVVVERLERRDVQQAQALARRSCQPVDAVQEGGERLPRPGRRLDQRVLTGGDRRPALLLSGCRRVERLREPLARLFTEEVESADPSRVLRRSHPNKCSFRWAPAAIG